MKKLLVLFLCLCLTQAHAAKWFPLFQKAAGGTPTFTFQNIDNGSHSGSVFTTASAAGIPSATRFIAVLFNITGNGASFSATFNVSGTPVVATASLLGTDAGNIQFGLAYAVVPADVSGGGITLTVTSVGGSFFSDAIFALYTADSSQFSSLTPVTGFNTGSSVTSITTQANVLSGGAVLALGGPENGSNIPFFTTPNDPGVASDGFLGNAIAGHKNNSSAFSPANVTIGFSSDTGSLEIAAWR